MSPAEIRDEIIDILSEIAPDEDLSDLKDECRFASRWNSTAWISWTLSWSSGNAIAFRFLKTNTASWPACRARSSTSNR